MVLTRRRLTLPSLLCFVIACSDPPSDNAFDDYQLARQAADRRAPAHEVAELVVRGSERARANDPDRFDIGFTPLEYWAVGSNVASAATEARRRGQLDRAVRYELALLRYGQHVSAGTLLRAAIGVGLQRRAAERLRGLLAHPRLHPAVKASAILTLRSILASQRSPARLVRDAVHGNKTALDRAEEDDDNEQIARERQAVARLSRLLARSTDAAVGRASSLSRLCTTTKASRSHCRSLGELADNATTVRRLLRAMSRIELTLTARSASQSTSSDSQS